MRLLQLKNKICLLGLLALIPTSASAQTDGGKRVDPFAFRVDSSLLNREISVDPFQYRGEPIAANGFLIWPNLTLKQTYSDNILATEKNTEDDFITTIQPELIVRKDIRQHEFILLLQSEVKRFWNSTSENVENYLAKFQGKIEAQRGLEIPFEVSYRDGFLQRGSQTRTNINDISKEPLRNTNLESEVGLVYKPARLLVSLMGNYRQGRLKNAELNSGAVQTRNTRDINVTTGTLRVGYDISKNLAPFLSFSFGQEDFINEAAGSTTRNNNVARLLAGTSFNYHGIVMGNFGLGWEKRFYNSSQIDDIREFSIDGDITWLPQAKTEVTFDFARQTTEDNEIIANLTKSSLGLSVRHELYRDLFIKPHFSFERKDFEDIDRTDDTYMTGAELLYIMSPRLQLGAEYTLINRDSTITGLDLENNVFTARGRLAL